MYWQMKCLSAPEHLTHRTAASGDQLQRHRKEKRKSLTERENERDGEIGEKKKRDVEGDTMKAREQ